MLVRAWVTHVVVGSMDQVHCARGLFPVHHRSWRSEIKKFHTRFDIKCILGGTNASDVNSCQAYPHTEQHHPATRRDSPVPTPQQRKSSVYSRVAGLVHLPDEFVDVGLPVTKVTTLDEMLEFPCPPATGRVGKLERPKEVGCLA